MRGSSYRAACACKREAHPRMHRVDWRSARSNLLGRAAAAPTLLALHCIMIPFRAGQRHHQEARLFLHQAWSCLMPGLLTVQTRLLGLSRQSSAINGSRCDLHQLACIVPVLRRGTRVRPARILHSTLAAHQIPASDETSVPGYRSSLRQWSI